MATNPEKIGTPSPDLIRRIHEWIKRMVRVVPGPGLQVSHSASGRSVALDRPTARFHARIVSGPDGGPYVFRRQYRKRDGTWADIVNRDDPGVAYEANLQATAIGRRVLMEHVGLAGEYRFPLPRDGGAIECTEIRLRVVVVGCNCRLPDATVSLIDESDDSVVGTPIVTDGTGEAAWSSLDHPTMVLGGAYHVHIEAPPLFQGRDSVSFGLACGDMIVAFTTPIPNVFVLDPIATHVCTACSSIPLPRWLSDLEFDDSGGALPGSTWTKTEIVALSSDACGDVTATLIRRLSCDFLCVQVAYCCLNGYEENFQFGRPVQSRWLAVEGLAPVDLSALAPIAITKSWPADFGKSYGFPNTCTPSPVAGDPVPHDQWTGPPSGTHTTECGTVHPLSSVTAEDTTGAALPAQLPGTLTTGQLRVRVGTPDCTSNTFGAPLVGATVTITLLDGTPVVSGTTDGDGRYSPTVGLGQSYRVSSSVGSCPAEKTVFMPALCQATSVDLELLVCCGHVCVDVEGLYADNETQIPLPGMSVSANTPGIPPAVLADGSGRACLQLTSAQLSSFPGVPGTCSTRQVSLRITPADPLWLERCVVVNVPCNQTLLEAQASPASALLYGLAYPPVGEAEPLIRYGRLPAGLRHLCPDGGCTVGGWLNRGLIPRTYVWTFNFIEYEYDNGIGGTAWYSLLPLGLLGASVELTIDADLLLGDDPTSRSPFGTSQRVEYHSFGDNSWTPRGETGEFSDHWDLWLTGVGAHFRLQRPGYVYDAQVPADALIIPSAVPEGTLTAQSIGIDMPLTFNPCLFLSGIAGQTLPTVMENGKGFRWQGQHVEG